ncbi:hypothetical protein ODV13_02280 [Lactobacillus amylovorus]|uniref:hypothetical protein n=1 Tax=Lactobacillus amylovorus TaxID=1604 RepID=UPI00232A95EF|nr:hypothetical protein [Lactobacillus amylovorus]MDB6253649.1 hypothetical protein [Lactobacillus amylovorus]
MRKNKLVFVDWDETRNGHHQASVLVPEDASDEVIERNVRKKLFDRIVSKYQWAIPDEKSAISSTLALLDWNEYRYQIIWFQVSRDHYEFRLVLLEKLSGKAYASFKSDYEAKTITCQLYSKADRDDCWLFKKIERKLAKENFPDYEFKEERV